MSGESTEVERIYNTITTQGGFGLGLARMHSSGSSDKASFAGLMAEGNISNKTFEYIQKQFIEREVYDFEVEAVILDAIDKKILPKNDDWDQIGWAGWPKMQSLNPLQNIKALKEWLKSGLMPPEEIRGDLIASLKSLAKMKKEAEDLDLNLDIFIPDAPGAELPPSDDQPEDDQPDDDTPEEK